MWRTILKEFSMCSCIVIIGNARSGKSMLVKYFFCSVLLSLRVSNAVSVCRSCLQAWSLFPLRVHFLGPFLSFRSLQPFPCIQRTAYSIFRADFLLVLFAYMESVVTHFTFTSISFYCIRIQSLCFLNSCLLISVISINSLSS